MNERQKLLNKVAKQISNQQKDLYQAWQHFNEASWFYLSVDEISVAKDAFKAYSEYPFDDKSYPKWLRIKRAEALKNLMFKFRI